MASTLLLDRTTWDLVIDAAGNIAVAGEPYALAQDAASAIRTWQGECYFDTTVGVDLLSILSKPPQVALTKQKLVDAALTVTGIAAAKCFLSELSNRGLGGQVQVIADSGKTSVANFLVVNPQGTT